MGLGVVQETPKEVVSFELDLVDELSCFLRFFQVVFMGPIPVILNPVLVRSNKARSRQCLCGGTQGIM